MTIPPYLSGATRRVSDMVREMVPMLRRGRLTDDEEKLAVHLRGNEALYNVLTSIIQSRIDGRASLPVPSDPIDCKGMLERDKELRWLLSRLAAVYHAPVHAPVSGEPPA